MAAVAVSAFHRRDPEHRIECHVGALGEVALAEGTLIEDAVAGRCHGDDAGDLLGVRGLAEGLIDAGERVLPATLGGAGTRVPIAANEAAASSRPAAWTAPCQESGTVPAVPLPPMPATAQGAPANAAHAARTAKISSRLRARVSYHRSLRWRSKRGGPIASVSYRQLSVMRL
jgi:hypothetical protein